MKIVYCIYSMGVGGGVERVVTAKANALVKMGHEVTLITTDYKGGKTSYGLDPSIPIIDLGLNYADDFNIPIWKRFWHTAIKMKRHKQLLSDFLLNYKADIVVTTHRIETAFLPEIKDGSKKILEHHSSKLMYQMERSRMPQQGLRQLIAKTYELRDALISKRFDAVVLLTDEDLQLRGQERNFYVIPNPLPFTSEEVAPLTSKNILAIGRICEEKDFFSLVDIWSLICQDYPDWQLRIVGDGYLRESLTKYIEAKKLSNNISFEHGTSQVIPLYLDASIFVMTSLFEGLPMTLLESQSLGLPAVSYACPCGPSDIITDGDNGFLIQNRDKGLFAKQLRRLMDDPRLREDMGAKARAASSRYHLETIMQQWLSLFNKLLNVTE